MSQRAVECECGQIVPVPEDARGEVSCSCARRVVVPLPEEFDGQRVLISAATVERRVRRMIAAGQLPTTSGCACCGSSRADVLDARLVCERTESRTTGGLRFLIIPGLFWVVWSEEKRTEILGRDNTVPVPVSACSRCAELFIEPVRSITVYLVAAGLIAALTLAAGVVLPFFGSIGAVLALVVVPLGLLMAVGLLAAVGWHNLRERRRWEQGWKDVLSGVPVYNQLLKEYPYSTVMLPRRMWVDRRRR